MNAALQGLGVLLGEALAVAVAHGQRRLRCDVSTLRAGAEGLALARFVSGLCGSADERGG